MGLLAELQEELSDTSKPLQGILLKAKRLASKLDSKELRQWVDRELTGYESDSDLPDYRVLPSRVVATMEDLSGRIQKGVPVSFEKHSAKAIAAANTEEVYSGVGEIEGAIASATSGVVYRPWPTEWVSRMSADLPYSLGRKILELHQVVPVSAMNGILGAIRSKLLSFVLDIEKQFPDFDRANTMTASDSAPKIHQTFNQTIIGGNVAISSQNFTQHSGTEIRQGDFASLSGFLSKQGLAPDDIAALKKAISEDPAPKESKTLGPKVWGWLGDMTKKAAAGAFAIGAAEVTKQLGNAICAYNGIPPLL